MICTDRPALYKIFLLWLNIRSKDIRLYLSSYCYFLHLVYHLIKASMPRAGDLLIR